MNLFLQQLDETFLGGKYVSFLVSFVMVSVFDLFGMDDFEDHDRQELLKKIVRKHISLKFLCNPFLQLEFKILTCILSSAHCEHRWEAWVVHRINSKAVFRSSRNCGPWQSFTGKEKIQISSYRFRLSFMQFVLLIHSKYIFISHGFSSLKTFT